MKKLLKKITSLSLCAALALAASAEADTLDPVLFFEDQQQSAFTDVPVDDSQAELEDSLIDDTQATPADGLAVEETTSDEAPQGGSGDLIEEDTECETEDPILEETEPGEEELLETEEETEAQKPLAGPIAYSKEAQANLLSASNVSSNISDQNYSTWSRPVNSYLVAENNGYMRVENCSDCILIEHYDSAFVFQSASTLNRELPIFGGFYCGQDAYYLVFGQENPSENKAAEVIRVVKYDKNWNRLGAASLCGANTHTPFDFGSLRMTEYGNYLYIHTCHIMYVSPDGANHQANLTIQVNTSDMKITYCVYDVTYNRYGYCSHSFNQFIIADDAGNIVALDHGDGYPRTVVLGKHPQLASSPTLLPTYGQEDYSDIHLLEFRGEVGNNNTGASIGGLEYSASSYLTAGNSVPQIENWNPNGVRNIFVTATSRDNFTAEGSKLTWLTNYPQGGGISASTPHLVKLSNERFLLLWEQMAEGKPNGTLCYLFLDGNANAASQIYMANGYLSDCKPLTVGNGIVWYVTDGQKLVFYRIDANGSFHSEPGHMHTYEPEMHFARDVLECGLIEGTSRNVLTAVTDGEITYSSSDPAVATVDASGTLTLNGLGTCTVTASASAGVDYRAKSVSYTLNVLDLLEQTISVTPTVNCSYGDQVALNASSSAGGKLSYSTSDSKIATVSADGTVTAEGPGSVVVTIQAEKTGRYAGAMAKVTVNVQPKDIHDCQLVFTKIGEIPFSYFSEYVALMDGERIMEFDTDYEWRYWEYSTDRSQLFALTLYVKGYGNYTGYEGKSILPISPKMTLTSVTMGEKGANLRWKAETGAMGYQVYRKQGSGKYKLIKTIKKSDTVSWTDTEALSIRDTLSYYIKAYTTDGTKTIYTEASASRSVSTSSSWDITLSGSSFTYNGKAQKPSVTVKYGGKKLTEGKDYTATYKNNKNAGTASVTITGAGSYKGKGSVTKNFTIKKAAQTLNASLSANTVDIGKTVTVTVKGAIGKVTYKSGNKKTATVNVNGKVKGVAAGKATITVTAAGDKNHKSASKKFTVTVKAAAKKSLKSSSCKIQLSKTSWTYTGKAIKPKVTVTYGSKTLKQGKDYTVKYANNKKAGKATATVTGKGNYTGKVKKTFTIKK